jgi:hypothetical protein
MVKQDRFDISGQYAMRVINQGSFLASFNVTDTELGIEFRDVCLFTGVNGDFVKSPFKEYTDKEGEVKKLDLWRASYNVESKQRNPKGDEYLAAMTQAARAVYDEQNGTTASAAPAKRAAARGGRGPVAARPAAKTAPRTAPTTAKKELPF